MNEAERLEAANTELAEASKELNEAYTRYQAAILARIALRQEMRHE